MLPAGSDHHQDGAHQVPPEVIPTEPPLGGAGLSRSAAETAAEVTALSHFYRGELARSNTWRTRLDTTTNWAVLTTGGLISFGFNSPQRFPLVLVLNSIILLFFLLIEARRYRFYDVWRSRVRVLEVNFMLPFLSKEVCRTDEAWREGLARDLLVPRFNVSLWEAFGRRFRRNYVWIYLLLVAAWLADLAINLDEGRTVSQFVQRAGIGWAPGWLVLLLQASYFLVLALIALVTSRQRHASGVILGPADQDSCVVLDETHF